MIIINGRTFETYYGICQAYDIDYNEFIDYMVNNPNIKEFDLLLKFIPNIKLNITNGKYVVK